MRRNSVLAAMVAAVVLGLAGLTGTSLAATSQLVAHPDGGAGGGGEPPNEGPNGGVCTVKSCFNDPNWEFGGFDGNYPFDDPNADCSAIGEPTGVKAPVKLEYEAWGEAEFEVAPGCLSAVWLKITGPASEVIPPEGQGPESLVVHIFRLYSIRPAETHGATHYWAEAGHAWSPMLDGREGCIVAFVGVMPKQGQGLSPDSLTELEWGHCTPPGTEQLAKEVLGGEKPITETPKTEPKGLSGVLGQPEPRQEIGGAYYQSSPEGQAAPTVIVVRVEGPKAKKAKKVKKPAKRHNKKKASGRTLRKKHKRSNEPYFEVAGGD